MNLHFVGKISFAIAGVFAVSAANAALLDFTIPTSGFATEGYSAVAGTDPSAAITANQITGEAGFKTIRLDVDGENLDIYLDDILGGNPYFDADDGGSPGGLGSCRTLNASAQCVPNNDDNLTITANESLRMYF